MYCCRQQSNKLIKIIIKNTTYFLIFAMATYSNKHWLLSHIRNSFISTDDTGMCETVMLSDDMPKHFLRQYQKKEAAASVPESNSKESAQKSKDDDSKTSSNPEEAGAAAQPECLNRTLQEVDFVCYPGLDLSDDEDIDMSTQSFEIQMYPEVGAHRFRSNTAQKLEKLDNAKRKAARIKTVNFNDKVIPPDRADFFVRKPVQHECSEEAASEVINHKLDELKNDGGVKSKLTQQLAHSPKQVQNKFMEYARFDGTSQIGMQTKRINVFLAMLPERERSYPIKICVLATAKIIEVIGFVCYKATIQYPDIPLKSIRHYALYMTEDNDDMEDFPPLDNREPCSKFGFSHLTLAEKRPLAPVTRIDYHNNLFTKSMTSEEDKANLAEAALRALKNIDLNGGISDSSGEDRDQMKEFEERMLNHNDMLEAPMYRSYKVNFIDKRFFKYEVTLGISGERIEIDHSKNPKFWINKKTVVTPIDSIAHCEIIERKQLKATVRMWLKSNSSSTSTTTSCTGVQSSSSGEARSSMLGAAASPNSSSSHYGHHGISPFSLFSSNAGMQIRFKHYDFETDTHTAEHIHNKLNYILELRNSEMRREFFHQRERRAENKQTKKQLKM